MKNLFRLFTILGLVLLITSCGDSNGSHKHRDRDKVYTPAPVVYSNDHYRNTNSHNSYYKKQQKHLKKQSKKQAKQQAKYNSGHKSSYKNSYRPTYKSNKSSYKSSYSSRRK